jgi:hypothetical protein
MQPPLPDFRNSIMFLEYPVASQIYSSAACSFEDEDEYGTLVKRY